MYHQCGMVILVWGEEGVTDATLLGRGNTPDREGLFGLKDFWASPLRDHGAVTWPIPTSLICIYAHHSQRHGQSSRKPALSLASSHNHFPRLHFWARSTLSLSSSLTAVGSATGGTGGDFPPGGRRHRVHCTAGHAACGCHDGSTSVCHRWS